MEKWVNILFNLITIIRLLMTDITNENQTQPNQKKNLLL